MTELDTELPIAILDILPNPVLVKNENLEYVWVNQSFEQLFKVDRDKVIGRYDKELFPDRQVAQCSGGDMRVLETGQIDEAVETVFKENGEPREMITRKDRLITKNREQFLVGVMHDITDVTRTNTALQAATDSLKEQTTQLELLASTDVLTGCSNRRGLIACEENLFHSEDISAALLLVDIDHFKSVNDVYGHDCGDAVLRHFANLVRNRLSNADYFIRLGGEEFAICFNTENAIASERYADYLRELVESTAFIFNNRQIEFTVSIGVAVKQPGTVISIDEMLKKADASLYEAKTRGRNQVVVAAA